ncbi:MAG: hypothetical protein J6386_09980 [Candidatus Synoicihabitans palmerolidicus]|nr:hypothetical protein [Candidatus Synoicihabitans palmerolidicus]
MPLLPFGLGLSAALILAGIKFQSLSSPVHLALLISAICALGALHHELHRNRLPDWDFLPDREANLHVRIDRVFNTTDHAQSISAIGTITASSLHLTDLIGQSLRLEVWRNHRANPVIRDTTIRVRGQLQPVPRQSDGREFTSYLEPISRAQVVGDKL